MTRDDPLARLAGRLEAVRRALERGEELGAERLSSLVRDLQSPGLDEAHQAAAPADRLIALLDEASSLRSLLERDRVALRQALEAAARRRLGRTAYQRSARG